jgi:hypothetical protein
MEIRKARELQVGKYDEEFVSTPFLERKWVDVNDIIEELRCPEVNDMETIEEAYDQLAQKMNYIIDVLSSNSSSDKSESFNKGLNISNCIHYEKELINAKNVQD